MSLPRRLVLITSVLATMFTMQSRANVGESNPDPVVTGAKTATRCGTITVVVSENAVFLRFNRDLTTYRSDPNLTRVGSLMETALEYLARFPTLGTFGDGVKRVSLFVKAGGFDDDYAFYKHAVNGAGTTVAIAEADLNFGSDGKMKWVDVKQRIEEMNDKTATGSRSGDIMMLTDSDEGAYFTPDEEDEVLTGWHGGPTKTESEVPMMWYFQGATIDDPDRSSDLLTIISGKTTQAKGSDSLRTRDFRAILDEVLKAVNSNNHD